MYGYNNFGNSYIPPIQRQMPMTQTPIMQTQQMQSPFQDVRFVNEKEADGYIVLAGQRVLLIDIENKKMWIKSADGMGYSTTETYRFEKIENNSEKTKETPIIDTSNFLVKKDLENVATKDELGSLKEIIEQLEKRIKINQILNENSTSNLKKE